MKKKLIILTLLLLLITGCNKKEEIKEKEEANNITTWKQLYKGKITSVDTNKINYYYLTDINNDNIPELILVAGNNTSDKLGEIFEIKDNELISHGSFSLSYSKLYKEDNYIIRQMTHNNGEIIYHLSLNDNSFEESKISEKEYNEDEEYQTFDNEILEHNILDYTPFEEV